MLTIKLSREKPDDGQRYCDLCGVILSNEILEAQRETLVGPMTDKIADRMLDRASAPFRRGEDWCYLCAYGASAAFRSMGTFHTGGVW